MSDFSVKFDCDNAAFDEHPETETARILHEIAEKIENGIFNGNVRDLNGNTIGTFALTTDGE